MHCYHQQLILSFTFTTKFQVTCYLFSLISLHCTWHPQMTLWKKLRGKCCFIKKSKSRSEYIDFTINIKQIEKYEQDVNHTHLAFPYTCTHCSIFEHQFVFFTWNARFSMYEANLCSTSINTNIYVLYSKLSNLLWFTKYSVQLSCNNRAATRVQQCPAAATLEAPLALSFVSCLDHILLERKYQLTIISVLVYLHTLKLVSNFVVTKPTE